MVKAKGFESALCESWSGWDLADTLVHQFYDAKLTDEMRSKTGVDDDVCLTIDLETMKAIGYDDEGNELFSVQIKMSIG